MYEEIVRHLMKWEIFTMIFWTLLCLVLPVSVHAYLSRKAKRKKKKRNKAGKKTWKQFFSESPEGRALSWVIIGVVFFCIFFGTDFYQYLSLREDMINETYITYTGEFYCYEHKSGKSSTEYVRFQNADGEQIEVEYSHHINKYQEHGKKLEEDTYYTGTIVYSPSSDYLLWWDAEPIED